MFPGNNEIQPNFVIDYCQIVQHLQAWVDAVVRTKKAPYALCSITGFVKVGKSTALNFILPALLYRQFKTDFQICKIDFSSLPDSSTALNVLSNLLETVSDWANKNIESFSFVYSTPSTIIVCKKNQKSKNPKKPPKIQKKKNPQKCFNSWRSFLEALSIHCANKKTRVFFLWDEIQRFFQIAEKSDLNNLYIAFKNIATGHYDNLYFAVTGSGMVQAWTAFSRAPANGHTVLGLASNVFIKPNSSLEVANLCKDKLRKEYPGLNETLFENVPNTPASICWFARDYYKSSILNISEWDEAAFNKLESKYRFEFEQDMLPVIRDMTKETKNIMLDLSLGICDQDLRLLFSYLKDYFDPFIIPYDPTSTQVVLNWEKRHGKTRAIPSDLKGFIRSEFSDLIVQHIRLDGSVVDTSLIGNLPIASSMVLHEPENLS